MSPPISKDWWVAAALSSAALPAALSQQQAPSVGAAPRPAAVVTTGVVGQRQMRPPIYIEKAQGQKLTTGPNETMHVLFSDQSAITVGPNSEVVIAEYRFDNQSKEGNILIDFSKGLLRVVGGFISKKYETQVRTSTATIGIRGGIATFGPCTTCNVGVQDQGTSATFLFGQSMRATSNDGTQRQTITRPGFGVDITNNGISGPQRTSQQQLQNFNNLLAGGGSVGAPGPAPSPGVGGGTLPTNNNQIQTLSNDRLQNRNQINPLGGNNLETLRDLLNQQTPNQS